MKTAEPSAQNIPMKRFLPEFSWEVILINFRKNKLRNYESVKTFSPLFEKFFRSLFLLRNFMAHGDAVLCSSPAGPPEGRGWEGHLWLGGVGRQHGAEGGPVEGGVVVQRGHAHRQVPGAEADGRTFKLQLVDQLVHRPQGSEGGGRGSRVRTPSRWSSWSDSRAPPTSQRWRSGAACGSCSSRWR